MTWVKICGITNLEDALMAVDAGADALGFVFYEKSPRYVDPETAREIVAKLPDQVEKVGVFVDASSEQMEDLANRTGLTGIQAHSPRPSPKSEAESGFNPKTAKYLALRVSELMDEDGFAGFAWSQGADALIRAILLDSGTDIQPGGTGKTFDWRKAEPTIRMVQQTFRVAVAGGLTPGNVVEAMRTLKPWGVDVASGVEVSPGKKDPGKVRAFIAAVRQEDGRN